MVQYSIIAAISENYVLADDDGIPWHIPEDLEHYKSTVSGHYVVSGRKTYEAMGGLVGKGGVIMSRNPNFQTDNSNEYHAENMEDAMDIFENICEDDETVYVVGGEAIYRMFIDIADKMVLSHVDGFYDGNVYFPEFDESDWTVTNETEKDQFTIREYKR